MSENRTLTFSQREGYEELPSTLRLGELPNVARTRIWNILYLCLDGSREVGYSALLGDPWEEILRDAHAWHLNLPLDEWNRRFDSVCSWLREIVEHAAFHHVFNLIEYIMRHRSCPAHFVAHMHLEFTSCHLAYVIDAGPPIAILQAATPEEGSRLTQSLGELRKAGLNGSATHLQRASKCINDRDPAGSVRESIHAVESVARQIDPKASKGLGAALTSLERQGALHPAFKQAISKLYGYTSDEQGIRHSLLDKAAANVTIDEAVFMLGACASFASYLWRKHKAATAP